MLLQYDRCHENSSHCHSIDLIGLDPSIAYDKFVTTYDFTFCRVLFDGKKLFISEAEAIICQYAEIDDQSLMNALYFADYRGSAYHSYTLRIEDSVKSIKNRAEKYTTRGFKIKGADDPLLDKHIELIAKHLDEHKYWCFETGHEKFYREVLNTQNLSLFPVINLFGLLDI